MRRSKQNNIKNAYVPKYYMKIMISVPIIQASNKHTKKLVENITKANLSIVATLKQEHSLKTRFKLKI